MNKIPTICFEDVYEFCEVVDSEFNRRYYASKSDEAVDISIFAKYDNARKIIKKAFENQINNKGFSIVEVISTCPTNWGMTPEKALEWVDEKMIPYYPLGVYKDRSAEIQAKEDK